MIGEETYKRVYYWKKNPAWYRPVNNSYEYELTDQATEKARESYAQYKAAIDQILALDGATPYEGVIIDL